MSANKKQEIQSQSSNQLIDSSFQLYTYPCLSFKLFGH